MSDTRRYITASGPTALRSRLSVMMFLQYAIWGAWLPIFYQFLTVHRGLAPDEAGYLFAIGAIGALLAPFIAGQIADRYFNTEKFLAISHIVGGVLVWQLAGIEDYGQLVVFALLYSMIYAPTLPLTNSLAFHHLKDRDRDFGKVRVWGTIGWIAAGIGIGQWLLYQHTPATGTPDIVQKAQIAGMADAFRLSAILGIVLGIYCLTLPKTPPQRGKQKFAPLQALAEIKRMPLLALFLIAFPMSCVHQFYFVHTSGYLNSMKLQSPLINSIFGVGGGGLMTIGQIAEIVILALVPLAATRVSRKALLTVGLTAYVVRFALFAYAPQQEFIIPALALHGLCFGCFFFVAFLIVDENTTADVRASAQGLFNLVIIGFGTIAGNIFATKVAGFATRPDKSVDFTILFGVPMVVSTICLAALLLFYPRRTRALTAE